MNLLSKEPSDVVWGLDEDEWERDSTVNWCPFLEPGGSKLMAQIPLSFSPTPTHHSHSSFFQLSLLALWSTHLWLKPPSAGEASFEWGPISLPQGQGHRRRAGAHENRLHTLPCRAWVGHFKKYLLVQVYTLNPCTKKAEAGRFLLSLRPAWSALQVPRQPRLHTETLSWNMK